jgi:4-alpha-glucanotransferase
LGGGIAASLPLLAAFLDCPTCEPSPYSPASRLFWNEFYLDIESIPEFSRSAKAQKLVHSAGFRRRLAGFRRSRVIDYRQQNRLRREVLEPLADAFFASESPRRGAFEKFLKERPEVRDYARFRAVCEQRNCSWHSWPERQRDGQLLSNDCDGRTERYYLFSQWLAQDQIGQLVQSCRGQGGQLYLDLPLGVNPDGFDAWRERAVFASGANAGAPPDAFFSKGQDWGFAPLHPQACREQGYRYVLDYLRFQMRHTGILRIDHVMGLHRLYWVPHNTASGQGAYVRYPADELYALLCLESVRHKTALVGEDLGTVPPQVRAKMKRHHVRGMYVLQFEQRPDPAKPLRSPPVACVASLNTHDMPTFAAHWTGKDIADRAELGLLSRKQVALERRRRQQLNAALTQFLRRKRLLGRRRDTADAVFRACLRWLSASPADVLLINLEDLWLEETPQNVPGTSQERPNWRRKARFTIEEITADPGLRAFLEEIHRLRH